MILTLGEPQPAGRYLPPSDRGQIWGWSIYANGRPVANMTANDLDLKEQRKIAEQMVAAYNAYAAFISQEGSHE